MLYNNIDKLKSDSGYRTDYIEDYPIKKVCLFKNSHLIDITSIKDKESFMKFYPGHNNEFIISLPLSIRLEEINEIINYISDKKNMDILTNNYKKLNSLPLANTLLNNIPGLDFNRVKNIINLPDIKNAYIWSSLRGSEEFINNHQNIFNDSFLNLVDTYYNHKESEISKFKDIITYTSAIDKPHWSITSDDIFSLKEQILNNFITKTPKILEYL